MPKPAEQALFPLFPPAWATVFGEDDQGIFAAVQNLEFEFRWIMPRNLELTDASSPSTIVQGFWLAEKAIEGPTPSTADAIAHFIEHHASITEAPMRLPTHTQLLAARETLRAVEEARRITLLENQTEHCINDTRALGLHELTTDTIGVDVRDGSVVDSAWGAENWYVRLAISAG